MRTIALVAVTSLLSGSGCTTVALNFYTEKQIQSSGDCRDQAVLNCLATVAEDPEVQPSYGLYSFGVATFTDTNSLSHSVTWAPLAYTLEAFSWTGNRAPKPQWTVDPTVEYEKLMAIHAACIWGIYGPERVNEQYMSVLGRQDEYIDQKPHFAIREQLEKLPRNWVHCGTKGEVPECVRYKARKGKTWIWVLPEDHEAFAQFTLILQDIATQDVASYYSPPPLVVMTTYYVTKIPDQADPAKAVTISTPEYRAVKSMYKAELDEVMMKCLWKGESPKLTREQWLKFTELYTGVRTSATGVPAASLQARATTSALPPPTTERPAMSRPSPDAPGPP